MFLGGIVGKGEEDDEDDVWQARTPAQLEKNTGWSDFSKKK